MEAKQNMKKEKKEYIIPNPRPRLVGPHQEITCANTCCLILNDIILHIKFLNETNILSYII